MGYNEAITQRFNVICIMKNKEKEKKQEREANYFAMCLLMPRPMMICELEKIRHDKTFTNEEEIVKEMARRFNVPFVSMVLRMQQLKDDLNLNIP